MYLNKLITIQPLVFFDISATAVAFCIMLLTSVCC